MNLYKTKFKHKETQYIYIPIFYSIDINGEFMISFDIYHEDDNGFSMLNILTLKKNEVDMIFDKIKGGIGL